MYLLKFDEGHEISPHKDQVDHTVSVSWDRKVPRQIYSLLKFLDHRPDKIDQWGEIRFEVISQLLETLNITNPLVVTEPDTREEGILISLLLYSSLAL